MTNQDNVVLFIAEVSANHLGSLERARQIVIEAAKAGATAVKFQTYTADTMTLDIDDFKVSDDHELWGGRRLYSLFHEAHTPWEWHKAIFDRAKEKGIIAFSTPFDETAVDFLETLDVPAYKIASFENTDWILLKKIAQTGKPVIMSTGVTNLSDLDESVRRLRQFGCNDIILLKCTSTYPATPENSNIVTIPNMSKIFNCQVGLSDHTMGIGASVAAIALGARVIEKHFTLRRADGGVDSAFSMEPEEFKLLVKETEAAFLSLGKIQYSVQDAEKKSLTYKRSLYVVKDILAGELISEQNVQSKRPALGLHTKYFEEVLGKKAKSLIKKGTPLSLDIIE